MKSKSPKRATSPKSPKILTSPKSDQKLRKLSPKSSKPKSGESDNRIDKSKSTNTAASPFPPFRKESDVMGLQALVGAGNENTQSPQRILSPKRHIDKSQIPKPEHHVGTSTTEL